MDVHVRTGKVFFYCGGGLFRNGMGIFYRQLRIDFHMKFDKAGISGLTGAKLMKTVDLWVHGTDNFPYFILLMRGERGIYQIPDRMNGKPVCGSYDDECNGDSDNGVHPLKVRLRENSFSQPDKTKTAHDACRGIDIGAQMPAIRQKGDGIGFFSYLEKHLRYDKVGGRGETHDADAPA